MTHTIWKDLSLETALSAVEEVASQPLTSLCIPRNSYINRVFEMEYHTKERIVVKFYRPHRWTPDMILGEHHFLHRCAELDIPVITPHTFNHKTLFTLGDIPFAIFPKKGGRVIDELNDDLWIEVGRLLGRIHSVGQHITDSNRLIWTPEHATTQHYNSLLEHHVIPENYKESFNTAYSRFIQKASPLFKNQPLSLIHGDCHFGNIIYRPGESLYMVDFDDCVIGPASQDIWMLLPDKETHCQREIELFKEGYSTFLPFPTTSISLIPALRIMRQIHFAAWCAMQAQEDHFKHHFPEWGTLSYWNTLIRDIIEFNTEES